MGQKALNEIPSVTACNYDAAVSFYSWLTYISSDVCICSVLNHHLSFFLLTFNCFFSAIHGLIISINHNASSKERCVCAVLCASLWFKSEKCQAVSFKNSW